ncbi:hypothetical protein PUR56_12895, partial [Streptomyces sp. BE303]|nr:hypothetical protein [Streptomyces sp. BE303]
LRLDPGAMLYLGTGRPHLPLHAHTDATLLLLGPLDTATSPGTTLAPLGISDGRRVGREWI